MKTIRLLILFSLVVLGAYVEDKANAELRGVKYEVRRNDAAEPRHDVEGMRETRNAKFKNKE